MNARVPLDRRHVLTGAGAAGAAATAATVLGTAPRAEAPPVQGEVPSPSPPADESAGYRLSEHVLRYYRTART